MIKECQKCNSNRIIELTIKISGSCSAVFQNYERDNTMPDIENISSGGYCEPCICLDCGQVQGTFPIDIDLNQFELLGGP